MKKHYILSVILAIMFVSLSFGGVTAQSTGSISGDSVCGASSTTKCGINDVGKILQGVLTLIVSIGLPLLVVFIAYRFIMAWFALQQGNANAYKEALQKAGNAILGFFFIVALFGGLLLVALKYLGVQEFPLKLLQSITEAFIPHAYAQEPGRLLPNPLGVNSLYDFILSVLRLVMRFFIYPALIVIWVWTGFAFVAAQGNPEGLNKAKKWLVWAFVSTLVIFLLQAFLVALRGTVQQILPGGGQTSSQTVTTSPNAPAAGQPGSSCPIDGRTGIMGADGVCQPGRGSGTTVSSDAQFCAGKRAGTLCSVSGRSGTCNNNEEGVYSCYTATQGDTCITANDVYGQIAFDGTCTPGGRR